MATAPLNTPPNIMAKELSKIQAQPVLYTVAALFIPLALCLLALVFVLHSALVAAACDALYALLQYVLYLVWHRRGTRHSQLARNASLLGFYIPVLLALICTRAAIMHSIAKHMPHTSLRKARAVIGFGLAYAAGVWIAFHGVANKAAEYLAEEHALHPDTVTPSSLFLSLFHSTLVFTLLSVVSTVWVPTSDERLRAAETAMLKSHAASAEGEEAATAKPLGPSHYAAHLSYLLLEDATDRRDGGSNRPDENEGAQTMSNTSSAPVSPVSSSLPPLVFLHGFGAGKAFWARNLRPVSAGLPGRRVYAVDLIGMGCSEHARNMDECVTVTDAESYFVDALEAWRIELGLERFVLVGHSFGGYISACYALRYPRRVEHLVLASPVGLPAQPPQDPTKPVTTRVPAWAQRAGIVPALRWLWSSHVTLSMGLHVLGPFGPWLFGNIVRGRFAHLAAPDTPSEARVDLAAVVNYVYHLNAGACPGHRGLNLLLKPGAYAIDPLLPRLATLQTSVTLLYGASDWMDADSGHQVASTLMTAASTGASSGASTMHAECLIIPRAGHQLFLENARDFNQTVVRVVRAAEERRDQASASANANGAVERTAEATESDDEATETSSDAKLHQRGKKASA